MSFGSVGFFSLPILSTILSHEMTFLHKFKFDSMNRKKNHDFIKISFCECGTPEIFVTDIQHNNELLS